MTTGVLPNGVVALAAVLPLALVMQVAVLSLVVLVAAGGLGCQLVVQGVLVVSIYTPMVVVLLEVRAVLMAVAVAEAVQVAQALLMALVVRVALAALKFLHGD